MNLFTQILTWARSRTGLIVIAGIMLALNIGRLATNKYFEVLDGIESKQALLGQYRISTQNVDSLRNRIKQLEARRQQFNSHLFSGGSKEEISSAVQLEIQDILGKSGVNPESLRPITKGAKKGEEKIYGDVTIKIRLTGKLENFLKFLSELYSLNYLLTIENFTMKPFRKEELKIFLELKGYYRITGSS